jgi:hypothetical protein
MRHLPNRPVSPVFSEKKMARLPAGGRALFFSVIFQCVNTGGGIGQARMTAWILRYLRKSFAV